MQKAGSEGCQDSDFRLPERFGLLMPTRTSWCMTDKISDMAGTTTIARHDFTRIGRSQPVTLYVYRMLPESPHASSSRDLSRRRLQWKTSLINLSGVLYSDELRPEVVYIDVKLFFSSSYEFTLGNEIEPNVTYAIVTIVDKGSDPNVICTKSRI